SDRAAATDRTPRGSGARPGPRGSVARLELPRATGKSLSSVAKTLVGALRQHSCRVGTDHADRRSFVSLAPRTPGMRSCAKSRSATSLPRVHPLRRRRGNLSRGSRNSLLQLIITPWNPYRRPSAMTFAVNKTRVSLPSLTFVVLLCTSTLAGCKFLAKEPDDPFADDPDKIWLGGCGREAIVDDGEDDDHRILQHADRGGYMYTFVDSAGSTVTPPPGSQAGAFYDISGAN